MMRPDYNDDTDCAPADETKEDEIEEQIRCLQAKRYNVIGVERFKCAVKSAIATTDTVEVVKFSDDTGIDVKVCFINGEEKGFKTIPKEEVNMLIEFPVICETEEIEGEVELKLAEYRCFWDECNKNIEPKRIEAACTKKLIEEGIMEERPPAVAPTTTPATGPAAATTTLAPSPPARGSEDYFMFEEHEEDALKDGDVSVPEKPNNTTTNAVAGHQLSIGLGIVLARLL